MASIEEKMKEELEKGSRNVEKHEDFCVICENYGQVEICKNCTMKDGSIPSWLEEID